MDLMIRYRKTYWINGYMSFIDDFLIFSKNKQEHEKHLKLILELLKKEELYAKFSKYEFWIPKVQFLGYVIDSEGIHVDPAKIESIKDWTSPSHQRDSSAFKDLPGALSVELSVQMFTDQKSLQNILDHNGTKMETTRWLELLFSDYDCDICYHLGKANVIADDFEAGNDTRTYR
ncbi:putative reverse transcriptase domain-containing protein [Tanacetum coccineum]